MKKGFFIILIYILVSTSCYFYSNTQSNILSSIDCSGAQLAIQDDILIICNPSNPVSGPKNGLAVYDVCDITHPEAIGRYSPPSDTYIKFIKYHEKNVYCMTESGELQIISIDEPTNPILMGSIDLGIEYMDYACELLIENSFIYCSGLSPTDTVTVIVNIESPSNPQIVSELTGKIVSIKNDFAYTYDYQNILIFNLVNKASPTFIYSLSLETTFNYTAQSQIVANADAFYFLSDDYLGLKLYIIKIIDSEKLELMGSVFDNLETHNFYMNLFLKGDFLYLTRIDPAGPSTRFGSFTYYSYDITMPFNPVLQPFPECDFEYWSEVQNDAGMFTIMKDTIVISANLGRNR